MNANEVSAPAPVGTGGNARPLRGYAVSLAFVVVPVAINVFSIGYFRAHPQYGPLISILYLVAMIGSAWWGGYAVGAAAVILCICASTLIASGHLALRTFPYLGTFAFILISLLVSSVAASRKRVEQILRLSNERLESKVRERTAELERTKSWLEITLASIGDAVIATGNDSRIILLNKMAELLTGWSQEEATGRPLKEVFVIVSESTLAAAEDPVSRVLQTGTIAGLANHTLLISRGGRTMPIDDSASPIRNPDGTIAGVVLIFRDVTERRRGEQAAEDSRLALERTNTALERTNDDLQQFAYAASHDLQEPLRNVAIYSQLLARRYSGKLDAAADEFINIVVAGAHRMERLLTGLLAYTQASSSKEETSGPCDANIVLGNVVCGLKGIITENSASVIWDVLPTVPVYPVHLEQLFQNLIGNALKYHSDAPVEIHIAATPSGREWTFSVADNGIGIEPQYAQKIFGLFKRLHNADEYAGTGIGLAVCQKIVQQYGGRIWVDSQIGHGSVFRFTLPALPKEQLEIHTP